MLDHEKFPLAAGNIGQTYYCPDAEDLAGFSDYIRTLPLSAPPEVFGLNENALLIQSSHAVDHFLVDLHHMDHGVSVNDHGASTCSTTGNDDKEMDLRAAEIEKRIPPDFDMPAIIEEFAPKYEDSMRTVLVHECARYSKLFTLVKESLYVYRRALAGLVQLNADSEELGKALILNRIPKIWAAESFLSMSSLMTWVEELDLRYKLFHGWVKGGAPRSYWLAGFFFPQGLLTGVLQNTARKRVIAIDRLSFSWDFYDREDPTQLEEHQVSDEVTEGCFVTGIEIEGAIYQVEKAKLMDSQPRVLHTPLPLIFFRPEVDKNRADFPPAYECPVYKVLSRAGTLSTTGHSTNFVCCVDLPTKFDTRRWIKAGVALFLSTKE